MRSKYIILDEINLDLVRLSDGTVRMFEFRENAIEFKERHILSTTGGVIGWQIIEVLVEKNNMIKYSVCIKREDGNLMSTIVTLPDDFNEVSKNSLDDDKVYEYDELLENQVSDNIYFEGHGWEYLEIKPIKLSDMLFK